MATQPTPPQSHLRLIQPRIDQIDPYYRVHTIHGMFDQSELPPKKRTLPLRPFQQAIIAATTLYRFIDVYAPSQAGKTQGAAALAAELMYEFPGCTVLILSTNEKQARRVLGYVRNRYIKCHVDPELRELDPKGGDSGTQLILKESGSTTLALPHSMQALTGNPADFIILDEMARWDKEDPATLYAEAIARTGDTGGSIITISTFFGESIPDPTHPQGFRGNYFHYKWNQSWQKNHDPRKESLALRFTYHVSPELVKNIGHLKREIEKQGPGYFEEHYCGVPRKMAGHAIFGSDFKPLIHIRPDKQIRLNEAYPLFLCFDPGYLGQAAVLGQVDLDFPRLVYLRSYFAQKKTLSQFADSVLLKVMRDFPGWELTYMMDPQSKQTDKQTGITDAAELEALINRRTGQFPHVLMVKQGIEPGVRIMRSFMHRVGGFEISDHPECVMLTEALQAGLVCIERNAVPLDAYKKDGYYEHPGDAARYPAYALTSGYTAESIGMQGENHYYVNGMY